MLCSWYRWRWSAARDEGRRSPAAARHLERCAACRRWVAGVERAEDALAKEGPAALLAAEDAVRIWRQVAAARSVRGNRRQAVPHPSPRLWVWVAAGAATAALILAMRVGRPARIEPEPELARLGLAAAGEVAGWAGRLGEWNEQPAAEVGRILSGAIWPLVEDVRQALGEWSMPAHGDVL